MSDTARAERRDVHAGAVETDALRVVHSGLRVPKTTRYSNMSQGWRGAFSLSRAAGSSGAGDLLQGARLPILTGASACAIGGAKTATAAG